MRSIKQSPGFDEVVGPVEDAPATVAQVSVPEVGASPREESDTGAVASILLGIFIAYLGIQFWVEHRYHLVYARPGFDLLDLRPVVYAYGILSVFLLVAARRFSRWFAPAGIGETARIVLATVAFLLISEAFRPLAVARYGFNPSGRWGSLFSGVFDSTLATYGPLALGAVLLLVARFLPKVVIPVEPEPTDNGSESVSKIDDGPERRRS